MSHWADMKRYNGVYFFPDGERLNMSLYQGNEDTLPP
jgi:hypothetical protein